MPKNSPAQDPIERAVDARFKRLAVAWGIPNITALLTAAIYIFFILPSQVAAIAVERYEANFHVIQDLAQKTASDIAQIAGERAVLARDVGILRESVSKLQEEENVLRSSIAKLREDETQLRKSVETVRASDLTKMAEVVRMLNLSPTSDDLIKQLAEIRLELAASKKLFVAEEVRVGTANQYVRSYLKDGKPRIDLVDGADHGLRIALRVDSESDGAVDVYDKSSVRACMRMNRGIPELILWTKEPRSAVWMRTDAAGAAQLSLFDAHSKSFQHWVPAAK